MNEHVLATFLGDEAETLRLVEPLHGALCHLYELLTCRGPCGPSFTPPHRGRPRSGHLTDCMPVAVSDPRAQQESRQFNLAAIGRLAASTATSRRVQYRRNRPFVQGGPEARFAGRYKALRTLNAARLPFALSRFSRVSVPPWPSAIWRLRASPTPDPPGLVV